jgi:hypothetical protein
MRSIGVVAQKITGTGIDKLQFAVKKKEPEQLKLIII